MKLSQMINEREKFNFGFIGGSITEGGNNGCFIDLIKERFALEYPDTQISCVNAGVGGTNSALGLFRLERDLMSQNPDIVFIEFAVNDYSFKTSKIYMENMIRSAKKRNLPVVLIHTASEEILREYEKGETPSNIKKYTQISEYYDILQLNIGYELFKASGMTTDDFMRGNFLDSCHPNATGYERYADLIIRGIENHDFSMNEVDKPYLFGREISNPQLMLCESFANDMWELSYTTMYKRLPNYIYSFTPGDELEFEFDGSFLGIYYTVEKDSGIIEYCIDDGEWKERSLWDKYALSFGRAHFLILEEELEKKLHTVKIRNSGKRDEKSEGYYVRLGAFAIG